MVTAIGQGKEEFSAALFEGRHNFAPMQRPGRQGRGDEGEIRFLGAELGALTLPGRVDMRMLRTASLSAQAALAAVDEAWEQARIAQLDSAKVGLVVGGSNLQQRMLVQTYESYANRQQYIRPSYASSFFDTDISALCSQIFDVRGFAYSLGAASASGQVAIIHAAQMVLAGTADACIAVGGLLDLSHWECQSFRSVGAMGSDRYAHDPAAACRPFDRSRDGFIFGEACAAIVVQSIESAAAQGTEILAEISGWALGSDANRGTNPSYEGELKALTGALHRAGLAASDIDYVNPHGTGSLIGDETELQAIRDAGLKHARINATKSLTGHGLTAAGAVEIAATILQMRAGKLHPTRNLLDPIDPGLNWVTDTAVAHDIRHCLSLSMGFGGMNSAICLSNPQQR